MIWSRFPGGMCFVLIFMGFSVLTSCEGGWSSGRCKCWADAVLCSGRWSLLCYCVTLIHPTHHSSPSNHQIHSRNTPALKCTQSAASVDMGSTDWHCSLRQHPCRQTNYTHGKSSKHNVKGIVHPKPVWLFLMWNNI